MNSIGEGLDFKVIKWQPQYWLLLYKAIATFDR